MPEINERFVDIEASVPQNEHISVSKVPTLNLAIGPNCPVRCEGCYNHFGDSAKTDELIMAEEVLDFVDNIVDITPVRNEGPDLKATVSGGDPLHHPQIAEILSGLKSKGLGVKLDTVGTAFLEETKIAFKGRGDIRQVGIDEVAPHVDMVSIPLDGASQGTIEHFRRGRRNLFSETLVVANLLQKAGVSFGINTVVSTANIDELSEIRGIAESLGANEWQAFEYDPYGPNPSGQKDTLRLEPGQFSSATEELGGITPSGLRVVCKSFAGRVGNYFMVDDAGTAWKPMGETRLVFGHIDRDRSKVVRGWQKHLGELATL